MCFRTVPFGLKSTTHPNIRIVWNREHLATIAFAALRIKALPQLFLGRLIQRVQSALRNLVIRINEIAMPMQVAG